jgi:hypothetical protein
MRSHTLNWTQRILTFLKRDWKNCANCRIHVAVGTHVQFVVVFLWTHYRQQEDIAYSVTFLFHNSKEEPRSCCIELIRFCLKFVLLMKGSRLGFSLVLPHFPFHILKRTLKIHKLKYMCWIWRSYSGDWKELMFWDMTACRLEEALAFDVLEECTPWWKSKTAEQNEPAACGTTLCHIPATWAVTLVGAHRCGVLRKVFWRKRVEVTWDGRKLYDRELRKLHCPANAGMIIPNRTAS